MKLLLLLIATAACLCNIEAAVLKKYSYQDIVEDPLDEELTEYFNTSDNYEASLAAAAEYFRTPEATKQQAELAAAVEYFKAPQPPQGLSHAEIEAARSAAAEYLKAPEIYTHSAKHGTANGDASSFAAAAEYFKAPETLQSLNGRELETNMAAAAAYFRAPGTMKD